MTRRPLPVPPTRQPGTYLLRFDLDGAIELEVGRLGAAGLARGSYFYIGSAFGPGGVAARVRRHVRGGERLHWHVDRLRAVTPVRAVWYSHAARPLEHRWADSLLGLPGASAPVPGFGASDCGCATHLVGFARQPSSTTLAETLGPGLSGCWFPER